MEKKIYSVSEITKTIKMLLEQSLPTLWIEGEVSNFKQHYSGHFYFSLKDNDAQIAAVMWRSRAEQVDFELEDGLQVRALGNIRLYEKTGRYQIDILQIQPAGAGALQLAFEQLKKKLYNEGLFDDSLKKPLPSFPEKVAIITSPTGAAIRDILNVLKRRAPYLEIAVYPAKVQGEGAAAEIAGAIRLANATKEADVIITGRGGGSLEDLWAFNEETVARAIFDSEIPVVSAVGHEIDFTIADFVADMRAPTPSAAAELIVPDWLDIQNTFSGFRTRILQAFKNGLNQRRQYILTLKNSYGLRRSGDVIRQYMQRIDDLSARFTHNFSHMMIQKKDRFDQLRKRIDNLNPKTVLLRGYSITFKNGKIVRNIESLEQGDLIETNLSGGKIESIIKKLSKVEQ